MTRAQEFIERYLGYPLLDTNHRVNQPTLLFRYESMGTLDDARIHMGIPLTLYDVCIH